MRKFKNVSPVMLNPAFLRRLLATTLSAALVWGSYTITPYVYADGAIEGDYLKYARHGKSYSVNKYVSVEYNYGTYAENEFKEDPYGEYVKVTYHMNASRDWWYVRNFRWFTIPENLELVKPESISIERERKGNENDSYKSFSLADWHTGYSRFLVKKGDKKFEQAFKEFTDTSYDKNDASYNATYNDYKNEVQYLLSDWQPLGSVDTSYTFIAKVKDKDKNKKLHFLGGMYQIARNHHFNLGSDKVIPEKPPLTDTLTPAYPALTEVNNPKDLTADEVESVKKAFNAAQSEEYKKNVKEINVGKDGKLTITYTDDSKDSIPGILLVKKKSAIADTVEPVVPKRTEVADVQKLDGDEINKVKSAVFDANAELFQRQDLFKDGDAGKAVSVAADGTVTITYKDGSKDEIKGENLVVKKQTLAEKFEPKPCKRVGVKNIKSLEEQEAKNVTSNIIDANFDYTVDGQRFIHALGDNFVNAISVDKNTGIATIKYKDGSEDTIPADSLIYELPKLAEQYQPKRCQRQEVKDAAKLEPDEISKLKAALTTANAAIKDQLAAQDPIKVAADGTATFTYKDGSTATIPGSQLVYKKAETSSKPKTEQSKAFGSAEFTFKYKLTPIAVTNPTNPTDDDFVKAIKRFIFDNFNHSAFNSKSFEDVENADVFKNIKFDTGKSLDTTGFSGFKNKKVSKNFDFDQNGTAQPHITKFVVRNNELCIDGAFENNNAENMMTFKASDLFTKAGATPGQDDHQQEKDDAKNIIDQMVKDGDISKEEGDKLKGDIDNSNSTDEINNKLNEANTKANEKAEKEKGQGNLEKKKAEAEKTINGLDNLSPTEKENYKKRIKEAQTADAIETIIQEATGKNAENKQKKDGEQKKKDAIKKIEDLKHLTPAEKQAFKDKINQGENIENTLKDANAKDNEKAKQTLAADNLQQQQQAAKDFVNALPNLTAAEKQDYCSKIDQAQTAEQIAEQTDAAKTKNDERQEALNKARQEAKEKINKLNYLTDEEKQKAKENVDKAATADDINKVVEAAQTDNLNKHKEAAKKLLDKDLNPTDKNAAEQQITAAKTDEEVDQAVEEANNKAKQNYEAQEQQGLADAKAKAKDEIEKMNLPAEAKQKYLQDLEKAKNAEDCEVIVAVAQKYKQREAAKAEIDKLTHLNDAQKAKLKLDLDGSATDEEFAATLNEGKRLDRLMAELAKVAAEAAKIPELQNKDELKEAQQLIAAGGPAKESSEVENLIKRLVALSDKLKREPKAYLQEQLEKAKKAKEDDKNESSQTAIAKLDAAIKAAEEELKKTDEQIEQDSQVAEDSAVPGAKSKVDELADNLIQAVNNLDARLRKALEAEIALSQETKKQQTYTNEPDKAKKDAFDKALNEALTVIKDQAATAESLENARSVLAKARAELQGIILPDEKDKVPVEDINDFNNLTEQEEQKIKDKLLELNKQLQADQIVIEKATAKAVITVKGNKLEVKLIDLVRQADKSPVNPQIIPGNDNYNLDIPTSKVEVEDVDDVSQEEGDKAAELLEAYNRDKNIDHVTFDAALQKLIVRFRDGNIEYVSIAKLVELSSKPAGRNHRGVVTKTGESADMFGIFGACMSAVALALSRFKRRRQ